MSHLALFQLLQAFLQQQKTQDLRLLVFLIPDQLFQVFLTLNYLHQAWLKKLAVKNLLTNNAIVNQTKASQLSIVKWNQILTAPLRQGWK